MFQSVIEVAQTIFNGVNGILATTFVPGTGITFLSLYHAIFGIGICCALLTMWLGIGIRHSMSEEWRGGNNSSMKISDERKGDTR